MGKYFDFAIKIDPQVDTELDIFKRILRSVIVRNIKADKPRVLFISGDSGSGKSSTSVTFMELLAELFNYEVRDYFEVMNVFSPLEYPDKIKKILYDKEYKKANMVAIHESRTVVKASQWQNFLTTSIADINAMSRALKPLVFFIVSQFIRDVTKEIRYTLNDYITVSRTNQSGSKAQITWEVIYKDDRDIETPKIKKRKLRGYLVYPNGRYVMYSPSYFELPKPTKDLAELFKDLDMKAKQDLIQPKMSKLMTELKKEYGENTKKLDNIVKHYTSNINLLSQVGKQNRIGNWKIKKEFAALHDLDAMEQKQLGEKIKTHLKKKNLLGKQNDEK